MHCTRPVELPCLRPCIANSLVQIDGAIAVASVRGTDDQRIAADRDTRAELVARVRIGRLYGLAEHPIVGIGRVRVYEYRATIVEVPRSDDRCIPVDSDASTGFARSNELRHQ